MLIENRQFNGMRPKKSERNLGVNEATLALNCELVSDELRPIKSNSKVAEAVVEGARTLFYFEGEWLTWDKQLDVHETPVDAAVPRLFYTGDGSPKQRDEHGNVYRMGVPKPLRRPHVTSAGGAGTGNNLTSFYTYSFINRYGEEGDKSDPSEPFVYKSGDTLLVADLGAGDNTDLDKYAVTHFRLYRQESGQPKFVKQYPITLATTIDTTLASELGEVFVSENFTPPPVNAVGLHIMANGIALMFVGRRVIVSEPYQVNAYPYEFTTQSAVVGISSFDNNAVIVTTGYPEVATIFDPRNISVSVLSDREPGVCKEGITQGAGGVFYPAPSGLFHVGPQGGRMVTEAYYDEADWVTLRPESFVATYRDGQYVAFYGDAAVGGGWIMDMRESNATVRLLSQWASAAHALEGTDELYMVQSADVLLYQGGDDDEPYTWRSKLYGDGSDYALTSRRLSSRDFANNPTEDATAASLIERDVVIAANVQRLALRSALNPMTGIGGAINQDTFAGMGVTQPHAQGEVERGATFAGDSLSPMPPLVTRRYCDLTVYGDYATIHSERVYSNEPDRISYADRKREWQFQLSGDAVITQSAFAGSIGEMHSGS